MGLRLRFVGALFKRIVSGLPSCIKDATVAWWKDFNNVQGGIITTPITGVLAFDGINDYVGFGTNSISADGDFTVSFYMQLNSLPSADVTVMVLTDGSINDSLYAFMDSSGFLNVARSTGTASGAKKYDISGLVGTSFFVEIVKTTGSITSITIDGVNNTVGSANFIAYGTVNCFGGYPGSYYSGQYYIWDININDQHAYTGYPNGNTNAAWVDTIGAVDGSVVGTPTTANASYSADASFVEEEIGTRIDTIYYGQYLDATSGQIDFHRGTGYFDYVDPSTGNLIQNESIPVDGLFTVPVNGICEIGILPRTGDINGLLNFVDTVNYVSYSSALGITGTASISFYMFLDNDSGYVSELFLSLNNSLDYLKVSISGSTMILQAINGAGTIRKTFSILGLSRKVLFVEISKTTGLVTSLSINGVEQTLTTVVTTNTNGGVHRIGYNSTGIKIWDITVYNSVGTAIHNWVGYPDGNTNTAWLDTIGSINGTVASASTATVSGVNNDGTFTYSSRYPVCERAGTVLHDVLENTFHISVATPSWSESLYGSDFLNQCGFLDKTTSDSIGYTWESKVNGVPISLDDDCLVPIALWHYETLYDVDGEIIYDVDGEIIQVRAND